MINLTSAPLGVKHSFGFICLKSRAEVYLLSLMATGEKSGCQNPPTWAPKSLKNCQRPKSFVLSNVNMPFAFKVCLILSFFKSKWSHSAPCFTFHITSKKRSSEECPSPILREERLSILSDLYLPSLFGTFTVTPPCRLQSSLLYPWYFACVNGIGIRRTHSKQG